LIFIANKQDKLKSIIFAALKKIIIMGKGDVKTKRGKIINGSFGVSRPHKVKKVVVEEVVVAVAKPKKASKKA
jgi:30S ribosomal protein S31